MDADMASRMAGDMRSKLKAAGGKYIKWRSFSGGLSAGISGF
jgi:hypothetical protein